MGINYTLPSGLASIEDAEFMSSPAVQATYGLPATRSDLEEALMEALGEIVKLREDNNRLSAIDDRVDDFVRKNPTFREVFYPEDETDV